MTVFVKDWDVATVKQDKVEVRAVTIQMILPAVILMMTVVTPMSSVVVTQEYHVVLTVVHHHAMVIRQVHPSDQKMIVMVLTSQVSVVSAAGQVMEAMLPWV